MSAPLAPGPSGLMTSGSSTGGGGGGAGGPVGPGVGVTAGGAVGEAPGDADGAGRAVGGGEPERRLSTKKDPVTRTTATKIPSQPNQSGRPFDPIVRRGVTANGTIPGELGEPERDRSRGVRGE